MIVSLESLAKLDGKVRRNYPILDYEDEIPPDQDELDYVNIEMKGEIIA